MKDILIYLLNEEYEEELIDAFKGKRYIYHRARDNEEVINICRQDFVDLILVWPADADSTADLLTVLNMNDLGYIPVVPVVPKSENILSILKLPVADVIPIPMPRQEFFIILNQLLQSLDSEIRLIDDQKWHGSLEDFNLVDLIQMVEASGKDAILTLSYKDHLGQIFFQKGSVIKAKLRNLSSREALKKLVGLRSGSFDVQFTAVTLSGDLELSNQELLVELMQYLGEEEKFFRFMPRAEEDVIFYNKPPDDILTPDMDRILSICQEGESVRNILITLNEDNLRILKLLQSLIQDGYLVRRQDYNLLTREESEHRGLGKIWSYVTNVFKKSKKPEFGLEFEFPKSEEVLIPRVENPELIYQIPAIPSEEIKIIGDYLKGL
ncbi:MAG: hypothetical protein Kow0042_06450 [Calditrichia bacterium]